jgi:hypothetical protein
MTFETAPGSIEGSQSVDRSHHPALSRGGLQGVCLSNQASPAHLPILNYSLLIFNSFRLTLPDKTY